MSEALAATSTVRPAPSRSRVGRLFGDFGIRIVAVGIDLLIVANGFALLSDQVEQVLSLGNARDLLFATFLLCYPALFWISPLQATPGQLLLGLRVVGLNLERLPPGRAFLRSLVLLGSVAACWLMVTYPSTGGLMAALVGIVPPFLAAITPDRQALHDLVARSLVVNGSALRNPEQRRLLETHVSDDDPRTRRLRRPGLLSIAGNLLVLGLPLLVMLVGYQQFNTRDLHFRTGYALRQVEPLQRAIEHFHLIHDRLPGWTDDLGVETTARYPDGGYYRLENHGVIRIRFEKKPELKNGAFVLTPVVSEEQRIEWRCTTEGDISFVSGCLPADG